MSTAGRIDIRIPIGALFMVLGAILTTYGIATITEPQLYARSEGIVINLWWGLVMFLFGALMLFFGRRAKERAL